MEIIKIIGIALIALIIIIMLKQYRPEYAVFISILTGILILVLVMDKLTGIINLIQSIQDKLQVQWNIPALQDETRRKNSAFLKFSLQTSSNLL